MNSLFLAAVLALVWAGITGNFSGSNLLFGLAIGGLAALILRTSLRGRSTLRKAGQVVSLGCLFLFELVVSALRVSALVLRPDMKAALRPAIVAVPLSVRSDAEITLLASLITLTPGTLSVDVAEDRSVLYVHVLSLGNEAELIGGIKSGFERRIGEIFR